MPATALVWVLLAAFGATTVPLTASEPPASRPTAAERLASLVAEEWQWRLAENPILASMTGAEGGEGKLPEVSLEAEARRAADRRGFLERLAAIDRSALDEADRVTYDVFAWELDEAVAAYEVGMHFFPLTSDTGFHIAAARLPQLVTLATVEDYEGYLARLGGLPELFEGQIGVLEAGLGRGFVQPEVVLVGYEVTITSHVVETPEDSVFFAPFRAFPSTIPRSEHERLTAAGRKAVMEGPVEAFRRFLTFFEEVYRPAARSTIGASAMDGGRELYTNRIRHYTTLDL
ncbi:MAG: DUF885 family protein, partial [Holophagales bacterium]|nr:DUF885 family protein [Holophagales bacterium]